MIGRVIPLQGDWHGELKKLLPWYAAGTLDEGEHADLAAHLASCAECQSELHAELRNKEIFAEPTRADDVDAAWAVMQRRIARTPRGRIAALSAATANARRAMAAQWRATSPSFRGLIAAQAAALVLAIGALGLQARTVETYHALGAPAARTTANLIVKFRPDTTEAQLRAVLDASSARIVGGPTAADAYLLHADDAARASALTRLHSDPHVVLAEPVDGGSAP